MRFPKRPLAWAWVLVIAFWIAVNTLMWTWLIAEVWTRCHAQQIGGGETFLLHSSNRFVTVVANKPAHFAPVKEPPLVQVGMINLDHWIDTNTIPRITMPVPTNDICVGWPSWLMIDRQMKSDSFRSWDPTNIVIRTSVRPEVKQLTNAWKITFK